MPAIRPPRATVNRAGRAPARRRAAAAILLALVLAVPAAAQISASRGTPKIARSAEPAGEWQWTWAGAPLVPVAIDVGVSGQVWIIEGGRHRLIRIDPAEGTVVPAGGGEGLVQLDLATRVFARSGLKVFTLDPWNAVVARFDLNGVREERVELAARLESAGEDLGEAIDFCVDPGGDLFLLDGRRGRILQFDGSANLREILGAAEEFDLRGPVAIEVDALGRLFVLTNRPAGVAVLQPAGRRFAWRPMPGGGAEAEGGGRAPAYSGLAADSWGNVFVGDPANGGVLVLPAGEGEPWRIRTAENTMRPVDLAWDESGRLLVADATAAKVLVFLLRYGQPGAGAEDGRPGD